MTDGRLKPVAVVLVLFVVFSVVVGQYWLFTDFFLLVPVPFAALLFIFCRIYGVSFCCFFSPVVVFFLPQLKMSNAFGMDPTSDEFQAVRREMEQLKLLSTTHASEVYLPIIYISIISCVYSRASHAMTIFVYCISIL